MTRAFEKWQIRELRTLREDEVRLLMAHAKKDSSRAHVMLGLCYNLALRVCELMHLRVQDFDFRNGFTRIIPARRARRRTFFKDGKVIALEKELPEAIEYPLADDLGNLVCNWVRRQSLKSTDWLFSGGCNSCDVVKYNCPGGHLSKREAQRVFDKVATKAHLKKTGRGIHCLKHARLLEFAKKTKDPWFVRDAGRLASVLTSDVYVRHVKLAEAIDSVGVRF